MCKNYIALKQLILLFAYFFRGAALHDVQNPMENRTNRTKERNIATNRCINQSLAVSIPQKSIFNGTQIMF